MLYRILTKPINPLKKTYLLAQWDKRVKLYVKELILQTALFTGPLGFINETKLSFQLETHKVCVDGFGKQVLYAVICLYIQVRLSVLKGRS